MLHHNNTISSPRYRDNIQIWQVFGLTRAPRNNRNSKMLTEEKKWLSLSCFFCIETSPKWITHFHIWSTWHLHGQCVVTAEEWKFPWDSQLWLHIWAGEEVLRWNSKLGNIHFTASMIQQQSVQTSLAHPWVFQSAEWWAQWLDKNYK